MLYEELQTDNWLIENSIARDHVLWKWRITTCWLHASFGGGFACSLTRCCMDHQSLSPLSPNPPGCPYQIACGQAVLTRCPSLKPPPIVHHPSIVLSLKTIDPISKPILAGPTAITYPESLIVTPAQSIAAMMEPCLPSLSPPSDESVVAECLPLLNSFSN